MHKIKSNRFAYTITLTIVLSIYGFEGTNLASAQLFPHKYTISASFLHGANNGASYTNSNGFITPALFANYTQIIGFQVSGAYHIKPWLAPVLQVSRVQNNKWIHNQSNLYDNATSEQIFIAPAIRIYTPEAATGIFNRVAFYAEIAAGMGQSNLKLESPIMVVDNDGEIVQEVEESNWYTGMQARIGLEFDINQAMGVHVNYTLARNQINASLFNDTRFSRSYLEMGIYIKLFKSKNYYR